MNMYIIFLQCLLSSNVGYTSKPGFELPSVWTKDFSISVQESGGMQDVALYITYTYDSCHRVKRTGTVKKHTSFHLTQMHRAQILKKLREFNVAKIRSKQSPGITMDKGSTEICFMIKKDYCLADTGASEILEEDRINFFGAFAYLENFVDQKK